VTKLDTKEESNPVVCMIRWLSSAIYIYIGEKNNYIQVKATMNGTTGGCHHPYIRSQINACSK